MREAKARFPKGRVVRERYIVEELLGQGGFGAVYRVRDRRVKGNVFALKEVVDPNKHQRENFLFEGEVLRRLDHPSLPRVYRVFEDEKHQRLYMLMDYVAGPNLERLRKQQPEKRFPLTQALQMMAPIIEAVSYLHAQQPPIIHRDIKPANIIVLTSGEGSALVDFGIAKEYDQESTTTAIRLCSPGYGAPEQYVHGTNNQTDVYGLGATFYTLLTGEVPIDALYRITRLSGRGEDPLKPPHERAADIPVEVSDILMRAMAVNSQDRFATVQEFWDELQIHAPEQIVSIAEPAERVQEERTTDAVHASILPDAPDTPDMPIEMPVSAATRELYADTPTRKPDTAWPGKVRHPRVLIGLVSLVLLALVFGGSVGAITLWQMDQRAPVYATSSPTSAIKQATVTLQVTPTPTQPAQSTPTQPAQSTPTAEPAPAYPTLTSEYSGMIHNKFVGVSDTMALSQIQQNGEQIRGNLIIGASMLGSGPFEGTITQDNQIQFIRPMGDAYLPLLFVGSVAADGRITGTYCSYRNNQCDYSAGGHGNWEVQPV